MVWLELLPMRAWRGVLNMIPRAYIFLFMSAALSRNEPITPLQRLTTLPENDSQTLFLKQSNQYRRNVDRKPRDLKSLALNLSRPSATKTRRHVLVLFDVSKFPPKFRTDGR
jgi:hypothetical protein